MLDCIIVGQGIAGTSLSIELEKEGFNIMIIKDKHKSYASKIAAGLIQPISGKFLTLNKFIHNHFDTIINFYKDLEVLTKSSFFKKANTYLYLNYTQEKIYKKKSKKTVFSELLSPVLAKQDYSNHSQNAYKLSNCFLVDTHTIFKSVESYFINKKKLLYDNFDEAYLEIKHDYISYKQKKAKYIIFCTGSNSNNLSYFNPFSFQQVKGEVLTLNQKNHNINYIIQNDKWCVPISDNQFKFGSTYIHDNYIFPKEESWKTLVNSLNGFGFNQNSVTSIQSGIRLFGKNYLPSIGFLKHQQRLGLFSGFGSKGFSFAPIMAKLWATTFPNLPNELLDFNFNLKNYNSTNTT